MDNKTKQTKASVDKFLKSVKDEKVRNDCYKLIDYMKAATKEEPKMWGSAIVGFGTYHYKYKSGREGDFFITGFSPRKQNISIYLMTGFSKYSEMLEQLGKHKTGKSCLYIKSLDDISVSVLKKMIIDSVKYMKKKYPAA